MAIGMLEHVNLGHVQEQSISLLDFIQAGIALERKNQLALALQLYRQGLTHFPQSAELYNNAGNVLNRMGYRGKAFQAYKKASELNSTLAEPYNNMGLILQLQGQPQDALHYFEKALDKNPDYSLARLNRALSHLLLGNFDQAWPDYEARQALRDFPRQGVQTPFWQGQDLSGKTLLVYAEQGFGDTIQFVRYLPKLRQCGAKIILSVQPGLGHLLKNCAGFDQLIETESKEQSMLHYDAQIPIMSLPALFQTNLETIPVNIPYISLSSQALEKWRSRFCSIDYNIGIVWTGNPSHVHNQYRSCSFQELAALSQITYATFYSLQKGCLTAQSYDRALWPDLQDLDLEIQNFEDTAAIVEHLDLIITIDTAVAHLAGAMGKPVWLLLCAVPDWRWLLERTDSPWYPSMRLFRQQKLGDWSSVIQEICNTLKYSNYEKEMWKS